jgi:hypothetical protein
MTQLQGRSGGTHNSCFAPQFPRAGGPPVFIAAQNPFVHLIQPRDFVFAISAFSCLSIMDRLRRSHLRFDSHSIYNLFIRYLLLYFKSWHHLVNLLDLGTLPTIHIYATYVAGHFLPRKNMIHIGYSIRSFCEDLELGLWPWYLG